MIEEIKAIAIVAGGIAALGTFLFGPGCVLRLIDWLKKIREWYAITPETTW